MDRIVPAKAARQEMERIDNKREVRDCPNAKGYWELQNHQDDTRSKWNVLFNNNWPLPGSGGWIATNGIKTCMCSSLSGKWRKISDRFHPGNDIGDVEIHYNSRIKRKQ